MTKYEKLKGMIESVNDAVGKKLGPSTRIEFGEPVGAGYGSMPYGACHKSTTPKEMAENIHKHKSKIAKLESENRMLRDRVTILETVLADETNKWRRER